MIIDISHHQLPSKINYDELAKTVKYAIIRTQYGSRVLDRHYITHHKEFRNRGIKTGAYAWVRGTSISDMKVEAENFYKRTKNLNPTVWFLDVEEQSMDNMRGGVKTYVNRLRELGVKKVGVYIAHHLYRKFNLDLTDFDVIWIPHYGKNDGTLNSTPLFPCDIHQYTDKGKLKGYNGNLDLNVLTGSKGIGLDYLLKEENSIKIDNEKSDINVEFNGKIYNIEGFHIDNINYIPIRFLEKLGFLVEGKGVNVKIIDK